MPEKKDFSEAGFAWQSGRFVKWEDAKIPPASHAFLYGTGVFEGIACYKTPKGPALFRLGDHIERLMRSAALMGMKTSYTKGQIEKACADVVRKSKLEECYLRVVLGYGYGKIGLAPLGMKPDLTIMAWQQGGYLGGNAKEKGIRLMTSSFRRVFAKPELAAAKITGNYYVSALAKMEALEAGFDEALLLDGKGFVSECSVENVFIVRGAKAGRPELITPPAESALPGITRASIIEIAQDEGIFVSEEKFRADDLCAADEVFVTGTSAEVTPVVQIDGKKIGNGSRGDATKRLQEIYFMAVHGRDRKYEKWLTFAGVGRDGY